MSEKVNYYYNDFKKIADNPIWTKLTVKGLNISHKAIQRAYKEMKEEKFRGDIVDYLCYIILEYELVGVFMDLMPLNRYLNMPDRGGGNNLFLYLPCRLILKDETYIDDVFSKYEIKNNELHTEIKRDFFEKINRLLKVEPKILYKPNKLKHS